MSIEKTTTGYICKFGVFQGIGRTLKEAVKNAFDKYLATLDDDSGWTYEEIINHGG